MGFKGKIVTKGTKIVRKVASSKAGRAALIGGGAAAAAAAGSAFDGDGGGMGGVPRGTAGLYRVTSNGQIIKVSQKRRKKGYRMPRAVSEMMRTQNDLVKAITFKIAGDVGK